MISVEKSKKAITQEMTKSKTLDLVARSLYNNSSVRRHSLTYEFYFDEDGVEKPVRDLENFKTMLSNTKNWEMTEVRKLCSKDKMNCEAWDIPEEATYYQQFQFRLLPEILVGVWSDGNNILKLEI